MFLSYAGPREHGVVDACLLTAHLFQFVRLGHFCSSVVSSPDSCVCVSVCVFVCVDRERLPKETWRSKEKLTSSVGGKKGSAATKQHLIREIT